jgi:protein-S-isoprenylcysteine O-methyltransferase Ste14
MKGTVYDALMRLPITGMTLFFLAREMLGLRLYVGQHPYFGGDWAFLLNLTSRVSMVLFLVLLGLLHITRRRPVRKFDQWRPKIEALLGYSLIFLLLLLPRAESNPWIDGLSTALVCFGNYLCLLALLRLGRSLSIMPEARRLVTDGLYRWIRHPLYLAEEIACVGIFLQFRSWPALAVLVVNFYFQIRRMNWEEKILAEAFPEYTAYCRSTHRLIPGVY